MDPMVGSHELDLDDRMINHGSSGDSSVGLIDLCSLCNRQFCMDGILESLNLVNSPLSSLKTTKVDKILNVFLADDDERSQNLQLCPNCKNLCESLIRTKHTVSSVIDHITNLLLQNSRFTLINSKDMIVSELFSDFNPYSSSTTASLMLLQGQPHDLNLEVPIIGEPSMEELNRQIADLESQFHINKMKGSQELSQDDDANSSSCSLPSIGLFDTSSLSGTLPKDQASPNTCSNIMNVHIVGNFGASIDILAKRRRHSHPLPTIDPHQLPPMPHLIADTDNDELELCFSNKLAQQKEAEKEAELHQAQEILHHSNNNGDQHQNMLLLIPKPSNDNVSLPTKFKKRANRSITTEGITVNRKTYHCMRCPRVCTSKKDYNVHMGSHLQERKYVCEVCGLAYRHKRGLEVHVALHKGEAEFKCEHCQKEFTQKSGLQRHLPIHTGVRGYQCEICSRRFLYQTSYNAHKQTHNVGSEKKFKCGLCPQSFSTSYHLKRHNKSRHLPK